MSKSTNPDSINRPAFGVQVLALLLCLSFFSVSCSFARSESLDTLKSAGLIVASDAPDVNQLISDVVSGKDISENIIFVDPKNAKYVDSDYKLVPWQPGEIESVTNLLAIVRSKVPGLIKQAVGPTGKLVIGRSRKIIAGPMNRPVCAETNSASGLIVLTDLAFRDSSPAAPADSHNLLYRTLVHELVHVTDAGYRLSYSGDWVAFVLPALSTLQSRLKGLSDKEQLAQSVELLNKFQWPSLYATQNLQESLAEYFSTYYFQEGVIGGSFAVQFAPHFLAPTEQERQYVQHFRRGNAAQKDHRWIKAINEFHYARNLNPIAAMPNIDLMFCYASINDYSNALFYADYAIACLDAAGVPRDTPYFAVTMLTKYRLLTEIGLDAEAAAWDKQTDTYTAKFKKPSDELPKHVDADLERQ